MPSSESSKSSKLPRNLCNGRIGRPETSCTEELDPDFYDFPANLADLDTKPKPNNTLPLDVPLAMHTMIAELSGTARNGFLSEKTNLVC